MSSAHSRKPAAGESIGDAVQESITGRMAIPQRVMQANIEAMNQGLNILNRRLKAQAELWSGLGLMGKAGSPAEAQKLFVETLTRDMADEVNQLSELAKRNFAMFSDIAATPPRGFSPPQSS